MSSCASINKPMHLVSHFYPYNIVSNTTSRKTVMGHKNDGNIIIPIFVCYRRTLTNRAFLNNPFLNTLCLPAASSTRWLSSKRMGLASMIPSQSLSGRDGKYLNKSAKWEDEIREISVFKKALKPIKRA